MPVYKVYHALTVIRIFANAAAEVAIGNAERSRRHVVLELGLPSFGSYSSSGYGGGLGDSSPYGYYGSPNYNDGNGYRQPGYNNAYEEDYHHHHHHHHNRHHSHHHHSHSDDY
jgi:hypothetical protein